MLTKKLFSKLKSNTYKSIPKFLFSENQDPHSNLFKTTTTTNKKKQESTVGYEDVQGLLKAYGGSDFRVTPKTYPEQFSKAPILDNYGELNPGEIPEPLKYVRPFQMTVMDNGIRVCTESWDSPTCAVGVYIDAGSRNETQDNSGSAHFLEHLLFKGTKNRTKSEFEHTIEGIGATLDAYTSREHTLFHMTCFKQDVGKCVDILGDVIQNPLLSKSQINEEKDTIKTELEETNKDMQDIILESAHFASYRDHCMGQPILGDIDNIYNVTQDMVKEFHATNYVGKNLVIVATGNVNHQEVVDQVSRHFGNLQKNPPPGYNKKNTEQCVYTPSCMFMRDDEYYNVGVGAFFDAPSWYHEDYYAFLLMERVLGNYRMDKQGSARINDCHKQYSTLEGELGAFADITKATTIYSPYSDSGLFGMYMYGNEVFSKYMLYFSLKHPANYGLYMNQVEVFRARARVWQELLNIQSPTDVLNMIGPQILYLNRRVTRAEMAKRIAYFDNNSLSNVMKDWIRDSEPTIVSFGACEGLAALNSYKYFKANTYITSFNIMHSLV